ncbi:transposase [Aquimarina sp. MAR_2010_214]|uniref:IS110 family transposase n=1 Tax=Aquimarina sp. MAR_2010_214 TaxID=1250026 RepID=UPI000C70D773|nr:IS110 family transposase [Aquimarina sp. MAR_2010_214]PKV50629.1 transposase [Aquimarina sp. MAR_2010_214]
MKSIYLGIDISKKTLDICLVDQKSEAFFKIENKIKAIKKLFKQITTLDAEIFIAMENTGLYNYNLYEVLKDYSFNVYVIDPKHIKRSIGLVRGKNDKVDAKRIATFIERNYQDFDCWKPTSEAVQNIKILMSQRRHKVKTRQAIKQQNKELKTVKRTKIISSSMKINLKEIEQINKHIAAIEKLIKEEIANDSVLEKDIERIRTIPGIGSVTAWTLAVKTDGFVRLTNPRKLACFAGVVPFEQQSGTSLKTKPRVSKMADMQLKSVLQMAAMRAVRMDNDLKHFYLRKVEEGRNKMSVLNAVRNKLIHIAMALIKNKSFYENRLVLS